MSESHLLAVTQRLDRLEQDHRNSRDLLIKISTQIDNVNQKIDVHNERINKREIEIESIEADVAEIKEKMSKQEGKDAQRKENDDKRLKKWGIIIVASEVIVASIIAVSIKVFWG